MPWLAFGVGTSLRGQDVTAPVLTAINAGMTHLDGAQMYENEETLGAAIQVSNIPRDKLYITTKLAKLADGESVPDSLRRSLARLKLKYVDLFLIHVPDHHERRLKKVWRGMLEARSLGLARSVGVSNFNVTQLQEIMSDGADAPAVNQVSITSVLGILTVCPNLFIQIEYHPFVAAKSKPLLAFHAKHNILTSSYGGLSPLLPGRIPPTGTAAAALEPLTRVLSAAAAARGATENQILLKWLQQSGILAVT